ncbi:MAG TPA: glutathione transferase [Polyangia bacterium]|jgi:glutathione S-transferase
MALTLYIDHFSISPYAFSAYVALEEKGVPYELALVSLADKAHQRADYLGPSMTGRVPAIDHDGFWLAESGAIVDYLDDAFVAPKFKRALPEDIKDRARARMVLDWIRSDLMPIREERATHTMFFARADKPLSPAGEAAVKRLYDTASRLLPDGASSLFGAWCQADSDLAFMLHRLILNGHELPPKLRKFAETQWSRPSVQKWISRKRPPYVPY